MTKEEILNRTKSILAVVKPSACQDNISYDTLLIEELGLDSLSTLLMGLALEREFDMTIADNIQFTTVDDVCEYILSLKA